LGYNLSDTVVYKNISFPGQDLIKPPRLLRSAISKDGTIFLSYSNLLFSIPRNKEIKVTKFKSRVIGISIDAQNGLWAGLLKGGVSYFKNSELDKPPLTMLNNCSIGDIYFDHEGGVWMASLEKGVFYIPSPSIFVYTNITVLKDHIIAIHKTKDKLLVNTFGRLMYEVTPQQVTPLKTVNDLQKKYDLVAL
jgi:ligand-binding sensor domain-containing protein